MSRWVYQKEGAVKRLTDIEAYIETLTQVNPIAATADEIEVRLQELAEIKKKYEICYEKICEKLKSTEEAQLQNDYANFHRRNTTAKATLQKLYMKTTPTAGSSSSANTHNDFQKLTVNLPRLDLPKFNGNYQDWPAFQDLFKAAIHDNSSLTPAQKLQYLKASLCGESLNLIASLQIIDSNYAEAQTLLSQRYDNTRAIVMSHMRSLFSQPTMKSESPSQIKSLIDTTKQCVISLAQNGIHTEYWDVVLIYLVTERLDTDSKRQWNLSLPSSNIPTFKQLIAFLENRCQALEEASTSHKNTQVKEQGQNKMQSFNYTKQSYVSTEKYTCTFCSKAHSLYKCPDFLQASSDERFMKVKSLKLCYNCLRPNHSSDECKSFNCKRCNRKHHTLLHRENVNAPTTHKGNSSSSNANSDDNSNTKFAATITSHLVNPMTNQQVLLATAIVNVLNTDNPNKSCTVLLDSASQATFISEDCVKRLMLKRLYAKMDVCGLGSSGTTKVHGMVNLHISSLHTNFKRHVTAYILPKVTSKLPSQSFKSSHWNYLHGIKLADPHFNKCKQIDILLGADIYPYLKIHGFHRGPSGAPIAQNSLLGWIVNGPVKLPYNSHNQIHVNHCSIDNELRRFWEMEEVSNIPPLSTEESQCEQHFISTHTKDDNGTYILHLPFKLDAKPLGNSKQIATKRFMQLERKLDKQPLFKKQYIDFMREYADLNHMKIIPHSDINKSDADTYYIPHHAVFKESSTTTKLRVVFDASAKTSTGVSLNENLMVGSTVQPDLVSIIMRFRLRKYAFTADIAKMYRQFKVTNSHTDFQRILWREDSSLPLQEYKLTTVTYGTAAAPFLATRALNQLAIDEKEKFPLASHAILNDFYVDDAMSGRNSLQETLILQQQLLQLMEKNGLQLRKWSSNCEDILNALPPEYREIQCPLNIELDNAIKTLGVQWHPAADYFSFTVQPFNSHTITKRTLLSEAAKLFDPLGWLSPVTITAKIMFQELWREKLDWDDELSNKLQAKWHTFRSQLSTLENIKIPRFIWQANAKSTQLHGFCDASLVAYSAAVYISSISSDGHVNTYLICSKTKVAPIKQLTIPRLELCGALLLSKLLKSVYDSLSIHAELFAWTDSTIVLSWLAALPSRWKTFVAHRVAQIQEVLPYSCWRHVSSQDNPADIASRGIYPSELQSTHLWWHGPPWLTRFNADWRQSLFASDVETPEERIIHTYISTAIIDIEPLFPFHSTLTKTINVTAYILRFIFNTRTCKAERKSGVLTYKEYNAALHIQIKLAQKFSFKDEYKALIKDKQINANSHILKLSPFINNQGLLVVGGRLKNSKLSLQQIHPILLPKSHTLTTLIIQSEHKKNLHAGPNLLQSILQQKYWIVNARKIIRNILSKCSICFRLSAKPIPPQMAQLPNYRVEAARPFLHTGVDLCGPFTSRQGLRGHKHIKTYITLFICMTTKAIHLELVSSLSSDAFIAAFKRFISRRGKCSHMYSDNGTNFVGANRELSQLLHLIHPQSDKTSSFYKEEGITWHFNPPSSPHFGGLWEAGVKSVKFHLKRIVGETPLTFEEMTTTLAQIEACLNSRPLTPLSSEPDDLQALTPGHFLIGSPLTTIPEPDLTPLRVNTLTRWQLLQSLTQHFWKRWHREYLSRLQNRPKWNKFQSNIQVNDLVLIKEDNISPFKWKLGRVIQTHPGSDNIVRVATLKTSTGTIQRPIIKLCSLPYNDNNTI